MKAIIKTFLMANLIMNSIALQQYYFTNQNTNVTYMTLPSCVAAPGLSEIEYSFNTSQVIGWGLNPQTISGNYKVGFQSNNLWTIGSSKLDSNLFTFNFIDYPLFGSVFWDLKKNDYTTYMNFRFTNPQVGFQSGKILLRPSLQNSAYQFNVGDMFLQVNPATPVSASYVYQNQNQLAVTNLILNFKLPCLFIPKSTIIVITFPTPTSTIDPTYSQNPLQYFDSFFCGALIDGVSPPGMTCNIYGGALYIENFLSANRTNMDFNIQLNGVQVIPDFFGKPTIQFYSSPKYDESLYFQDSINATIGPVSLAFKNQVYSPNKINQPNFTLSINFAGNLKVPLIPGTYFKFLFVQNFAAGQSINVKVINLSNSVSEVGVPILDLSGYKYILTKDYLLDAGLKIVLSNMKTPSIAKTYYATFAMYNQKDEMIGNKVIVPIVFQS